MRIDDKQSRGLAALALVTTGCGAIVQIDQLPEDQIPPYPSADDGGQDDGASGDGDGGSDDDDGGAAGDDGGPPWSTDCAEIETRLTDLLDQQCTGCHSGEDAPKGFDDPTDLERLVADGRIVPGDAWASPLFVRVESGEMPPAGVEPRPSAEDIDSMAQWIDECMVEPPCTHEDFITIEQSLDWMRQDVSDTSIVPSDERTFIRYFSLTHVYNSGICSPDLELHRQALSKALNSLSTGTKIVPPVAIDPQETIFRIDLRDYGWDAALWESLVSQNTFAIEYTRDEATDLKAFTGTKVPVMTGDWLVANATRPPLYHEILEIPSNRFFLEQSFGIDVNADIDADEVERSGFLDSGVSVNNRVIERHEFPGANNRVYWLSYDFATNGGDSNIFAHPLDFQEAGNEIIFSLPNGLHGYMITDGNGSRLDEAPDDIVTDPSQPDQNVVNGLSCMGCHERGIILRADEVRDHVLGSFEFDDATKEKVAKLHPVADEFAAVQEQDRDLYLSALEQAGIPQGFVDEPVNAIFVEFDGEIDLRRAAAELGITSAALSQQIGGLDPDLETLLSGTVKRDVFELNFAQSICDLNIGLTAACGGPGKLP